MNKRRIIIDMPLLELKNINFSYNQQNRDNEFELRNINFQVDKGDFVTVLGPNGSGKSTLLKIITNLLSPGSGERILNKKNYDLYTHKELAKFIAFVPQVTYSIFPFSVYEIVMMGRTPYLNFFGIENHDDVDVVNNALEIVGISHLRNKGINKISGGEAQRAFIARALVQEPELILLDEPNAHLDIEHQISIFELLKNLNEEKALTVISVSHDLNLSGFYAKRAVVLSEGKIILDDDKKNVLTETNIREIFGVESSVSYIEKLNSVNVNIIPYSNKS